MESTAPYIPYEILTSIVASSDVTMYLTYAHVSVSFRRIAYDLLLKLHLSAKNPARNTWRELCQPSMLGLAMNVINNQTTPLAAPGFKFSDWCASYGCRERPITAEEEIDVFKIYADRVRSVKCLVTAAEAVESYVPDRADVGPELEYDYRAAKARYLMKEERRRGRKEALERLEREMEERARRQQFSSFSHF